MLYACKKRIMQINLASEMNVLARRVPSSWPMPTGAPATSPCNAHAGGALSEVVAAFPVYRTYVSPRGASADDRRYIDWAHRAGAQALARRR